MTQGNNWSQYMIVGEITRVAYKTLMGVLLEGVTKRLHMQWDGEGRGRQELICVWPCRPCWGAWFHPGSDGKPVEGFMQQMEVALASALSRALGLCVGDRGGKAAWRPWGRYWRDDGSLNKSLRVGPGRNKQMPAAGALMICSWIEYRGWRKRKNRGQFWP